MAGAPRVSRRRFLATAAAGGILLGFRVGQAAAAGPVAGAASDFTPNAFIRISRNNVVTILVNKAEMGQGIYTSLPMLIAEELEVDLKRVKVVAAPVDAAYGHPQFGMQFTGGSQSIASEWERFRQAGATAREMLLAAAAQTWGVDRARLRAENGRVIGPGGRVLTYGQLVEKARTIPVPANVPLKDPAKFKIIGKPTRRLDSREKVTGAALFGIDASVPGMLVAVVARPPVFGGRVRSVDETGVRGIDGVKQVVQVPSGVAVVADSFWSAKKGRDALVVEWDEGPGAAVDTDALEADYERLARTAGAPAYRRGDGAATLETAARRVNAKYDMPYLAHAPMEPLNCLVSLTADRCEIWTGTQFQTVDQRAAAEILGTTPDKVAIHTTFLGGGFGRRANPVSDFVAEAVTVAKAAGVPVKVVWTREDDLRGGYYRPAYVHSVHVGIDKDGIPEAWRHVVVGQSILTGTPFEKFAVKDGVDASSVEGIADSPYLEGTKSKHISLHSPSTPITVLWWRSVGNTHTAFAVESMIDELAHAAGKDPLAYRLALLEGKPRFARALETAATKAGWGTPRKLARAIVSDIRLYHAEKIEAGTDLASEIEEGRMLFRARVTPEFHQVFEDEVAPLGAPAPGPRPALDRPNRFGSFYADAQPAPRGGSPLVLVTLVLVALVAAAVWVLIR